MKAVPTRVLPYLKVGDTWLVEASERCAGSNGNLAYLNRLGFLYSIKTILVVDSKFNTERLQLVTITKCPEVVGKFVEVRRSWGDTPATICLKMSREMDNFAAGKISHEQLYNKFLEIMA